ncbi:hypothetical protein CBR_g3916 [Chara braunii]|uniref:Right handed beta helix domain-containing protein n=1 Tax=Chara braunii TaxID=69332 RepID=A0A388KGU5_CHABU|nr:hypothetical protein CBR_g3916 [Chara braunii]|eukprot:GBG69217.1 hypothetical protein CBR_g3916 [Chara braunii]
MPPATVQPVQVIGPPASKRMTHADLVKAVTSKCSLVLTSDVVLTGNLPAANNAACPKIRIVGRCSGRKLCKIDGVDKYSFVNGAYDLLLENLEITRMRSADPNRAPVISGGSATVRHCRVTKNVNGVGDGVVRGRLTIENTVFEDNRGGVLCLEDERGSFANATDVVFRRNRNAQGGAVSAVESSFYCTRCLFERNVAEEAGGAVRLTDSDGTRARFKHCRFVGNKVTGKKGQAFGGAVYISNIDPGVSFCHCQFDRNMAAGKLNHVYIDGLEDSIAYFCPARPRSGIVITPKTSEAFVKDGCTGCK